MTKRKPVVSTKASTIGFVLGTAGIIGIIAAVVLAFVQGVSWVDLFLMGIFYTITMLGLTAGYHRLFTHDGYEAGPTVRAIMGIAGSMAAEGPIIGWVAQHRQHHAFSDKPGDPHSPVFDDQDQPIEGWRGFWHSHMGWLFRGIEVNEEKFAPDLLQDPLVRKLDRLYALWLVLTLALPALLGGLITWSWLGALSALVWGGFVRIFLVHHATWLVNSLCHIWGGRPFEARDRSRNNGLVALLTFGEGWHNNHHAFPTSARHGLFWYQVDGTAMLIGALRRLNLVSNVKVPKPSMMEAKRIKSNLSPTEAALVLSQEAEVSVSPQRRRS